MEKEFKLPALGEGVEDGEIVALKAVPGTKVAPGDVLAEVETHKAVMDVPADFEGTLVSWGVKTGEKVRPGQVLARYSAMEAALAAGPAAEPAPTALSVGEPETAGSSAKGEREFSEGDPEKAPGLSPEEASRLRVVVVGGGPGGYAAAFYAADLGFQVTLINGEGRLGGTCTLRGCIPSKGLLHFAKLIEETRHAAAAGIRFGEAVIDVDALRAHKEAFVETLAQGIGQVAAARKIKVVEARAEFADGKTLRLHPGLSGALPSEAELPFDYCILATGSVPAVPKVWADLGDERIMDSSGALALKDIPKSLLVIGGGYIGLEMACVYAALGSAVTVVEFLPALLAAADRDLARPLEAKLKARFKAVLTGTKVASLKPEKDGILAVLEGPAGSVQQSFDKVLVSVGRRPATQGLGLERTAVRTDAKGFVEHDAQQRTAEPSVFVVGDAAGEPMLAHKAHAEARVAVEAIAGRRTIYDVRAMPAVVFTDPELAWVGITEDDAKKSGADVEVARFPWAANGKAHALGRTEGLSKVIVDKKTGRILGAGAVGHEAGALISEYALAIEMGATAEDVSLTVHPHPTLNETLLGAVDVYLGHATDVYRPKRRR